MNVRIARPALTPAALLALVSLAVVSPAAEPAATFYQVKNLVSDDGSTTRHTDPNLINGWGLAAGPTTPWWVANNGTNTSTLYNARGRMMPLVVDVPGGPTGIVYNGGTGFVLPGGRRPKPALFIFANQAGQILGWNTGNLRSFQYQVVRTDAPDSPHSMHRDNDWPSDIGKCCRFGRSTAIPPNVDCGEERANPIRTRHYRP